MKNEQLEIIAVTGDSHLGGQDFDSRIMKYVIKEFQKSSNYDIYNKPRLIKRLRIECRKGKEALSLTENPINIHLDINDDVEINVELTRSKLVELCQDLFDKALSYVDRALRMPNISPEQINYVLLVGGSSKIPFIQQKLSEKFGKSKLKLDINPDEAVALGAAIYASSMESNNPLLDIKSLSINDTKSSDISSYNGDETALATPNYRQNGKVLFYLLYDRFPNLEGRICLFNSNTFKVELVEKFSTWSYPCEVAIGNDQIFLISVRNKVFEIFNYETEQLAKGLDPPEWRNYATVAYYKNKLYYIGGWDSNGQDSTSVNILVNGIWQRGPDFPINISSASHVICNDKLYIISENAVFQLSDNEREWIEAGKMQGTRLYPAVESLNGKIYITGGYYGGKVLNSCLRFDPSQPFDRRFTTIANMHFNRYGHSLLVANGKMYAIGGYQEKGPSIFCKSVEEYDPATNQWRIVGEIE